MNDQFLRDLENVRIAVSLAEKAARSPEEQARFAFHGGRLALISDICYNIPRLVRWVRPLQRKFRDVLDEVKEIVQRRPHSSHVGYASVTSHCMACGRLWSSTEIFAPCPKRLT